MATKIGTLILWPRIFTVVLLIVSIVILTTDSVMLGNTIATFKYIHVYRYIMVFCFTFFFKKNNDYESCVLQAMTTLFTFKDFLMHTFPFLFNFFLLNIF